MITSNKIDCLDCGSNEPPPPPSNLSLVNVKHLFLRFVLDLDIRKSKKILQCLYIGLVGFLSKHF
jgi:hypothetical protein